jgi:uncharacterized protein YegP (UPF0339 family)
MKGKFEVYKSKGQWYFRLKASNGEIIADSEGYKTKQGALKGVASVQRFASQAKVLVIDKKEKEELTSKKLVKKLVKQEKDYENTAKIEIVKTEEEKEDEKKVLDADDKPYTVQKLKPFVGPRWL